MGAINLDNNGRAPARVESAVSDKKEFRFDPKIMEAIESREEGNELYYDESKRPADMDYNWKRLTYGGKEDKQYQANMARFGWSAVPADRHPEIGTEATNNTIIVNGLLLMERHLEYSRRSAEINNRKNEQQLGGMRERLADVGDINMPRVVQKFNYSRGGAQVID